MILILILLFISIKFFTNYKSAFEADQACHYQKWELYGSQELADCDHDLETKKWILFEKGLNHKPAKVIKRFNY
tara:strand:+ start:272 stop:493 length:222 start_codon:yes stop_codon:yes gene_type:complete